MKSVNPRLLFRRCAKMLLFFAAAGTAYFHAVLLPPMPPAQQKSSIALPDFVSLARRFDPSLVHISTAYAAPASAAGDNLGAPGMSPRVGLGSGVIVRRDGYILTNDHVVANAEKVFVKLSDRRVLPGAVVGRDARSDLALIKISAPSALAPARLGNSATLQTGEWVVALGSPFGLDRTLTAGIVSAKDRRLAANVYCDYIQTDVTINPGNSGGPLLDLKGLVVGINTAILSRDGTNSGINFAIPINLVKDLLPQLLAKGKIARGWVGISSLSLSPATAQLLQLQSSAGALVVGIAPGGPAARAGIRPGDVVVAYDGNAVADAAALPALVARTAAGRRAPMYIHRNRILHRVLVEVEELKEIESPAASAALPPHSVQLSARGAEFQS